MSGRTPEVPLEPTAWLNAVAELTRAVNRGDELDDLLDLVAGATAQLTGYDFCAVLVQDAQQEHLVIRGSYGLSREYVEQVNARRPVPVRAGDAGEGPSSRAFRSLRPSLVVDVATHAPSRRWETVAAEQGYVSLLSVPLVVGQAPFGVLNCYTARRHAFPAEEVVRLESLANQAALAIETCALRAAERQRAARLETEIGTSRSQVERLQSADEDLAALLDVVLAGGGPQAVADQLGSVLRCDIVVRDTAGRVLGRTGVVRDVPVAALGSPSDQGLVAPFALDGELLGQVHAVRRGADFAPSERSFLTRAARVAAAAMLREVTAREVEGRLSQAFLDDLFAVDGAPSEALRDHALQLGVDLACPHTVLVVRLDPPPAGAAPRQEPDGQGRRWLLPLVLRAVEACTGTGLTAVDGESVVVLWRETAGRSATAFAQHLSREVRARGGARTATVSVGPTCCRAGEYGDAHRSAVAVLDLVQAAEQRDRVVDQRDLGAYRLLLQSRRPAELVAFARDVLGALHAYDAQRSTELARTLRSYMEHRCNVAATAALLHVHGNTVAYRLRRVEELLSIDLHDPRVLLEVELALMIERVLGPAGAVADGGDAPR